MKIAILGPYLLLPRESGPSASLYKPPCCHQRYSPDFCDDTLLRGLSPTVSRVATIIIITRSVEPLSVNLTTTAKLKTPSGSIQSQEIKVMA
jgi:hypothetical protein